MATQTISAAVHATTLRERAGQMMRALIVDKTKPDGVTQFIQDCARLMDKSADLIEEAIAKGAYS